MNPKTIESSAKSMQVLIEQFLQSLWGQSGLADNTISAYRSDLHFFMQWLVANSCDFFHVDLERLLDYRDFLRTSDRQGARQEVSIARHVCAIRRFYRYLQQTKIHLDDPTLHMNNPKFAAALPRDLSEDEVSALLNEPRLDIAIEMRDKAMLEVLYATGLRISELVHLETSHLDLQRGVVRIIGKGNKERLTPLGEEALYWLRRYLQTMRRTLLKNQQSDIVFPSQRAKKMTRQTFWYRIKIYAQRADIQTQLSPHSLRHAFATHLLHHGADLRVVQLLLGHQDLSTTQIYTRVATRRLEEIHAQHHPRSK